MEKYYLPISINKRRIHICHFTQQDYKEDFHFFEFIVHNKGNGDELFNINPNAFFINDQGCINDIKIDKTGIVGNIDNESIELTFTKGEYTQNGTITEEEGLYIRKEQSGRILVAINENYDENKIKIKLTLNISDNEKYHYSCIFHIVNSNDTLVEAGIDFGSESSQMAYRNVSKNEKIFPVVNIIENLKTFYHHHKDVDEYCHYYQYEKPEDSIPLFKSFFTVFTGKCDDLRIFLKPNSKEDATFINALLTKDITKFEDKELKLLPNLKYLQIQSGSFYDNTKVNHIDAKKQHNNGKEEWLTPDGINVSSENQMLSNYNNYYKRYILNYFLHVLFKVISENFSNPYIKLKLLVPNVYNQKRIYEIIHNIYKDCNSIINEYNEYRIKGIEVETISESDAAFLGFLYNKEKEIDHNNKIKLDSNKLFLLIDGGKGTLDFTILKSDDSSNRFNSIYRGGIPGSGQIINYAIMQIFNDGLKPYDIDIEEFIKTFNSSEKNEFLNAIEKIKQNCKFPSTGNNLIQNVDKNHIDEIQNQLKNIKNANNKESIFKLLDIFSENNQEIPDLNNRLNSAINALSIAISEKVEDFQLKPNTFFDAAKKQEPINGMFYIDEDEIFRNDLLAENDIENFATAKIRNKFSNYFTTQQNDFFLDHLDIGFFKEIIRLLKFHYKDRFPRLFESPSFDFDVSYSKEIAEKVYTKEKYFRQNYFEKNKEFFVFPEEYSSNLFQETTPVQNYSYEEQNTFYKVAEAQYPISGVELLENKYTRVSSTYYWLSSMNKYYFDYLEMRAKTRFEDNVYSIGDTGPAGGTIFYINPNEEDDWTYIEVAPESIETFLEWKAGGVSEARNSVIGAGKTNTEAIVAAKGSGNYAAYYCYDLTYYNPVEDYFFSDWYLPSRNELAEINNVVSTDGLDSGVYWSSTEASLFNAYTRDLNNNTDTSLSKENQYLVRPIRYF